MKPDNPADRSRAIRIGALRKLGDLLTEAVDPKFTGTVGIEIPSKDGRLGKPKRIKIRFGVDD